MNPVGANVGVPTTEVIDGKAVGDGVGETEMPIVGTGCVSSIAVVDEVTVNGEVVSLATTSGVVVGITSVFVETGVHEDVAVAVEVAVRVICGT